MRIYQVVKIKGARKSLRANALIDTGAEISIIPLGLAVSVGVRHIAFDPIIIEGIHGQRSKLPLGVVYIYFPQLNNIGGKFLVAVSNKEKEPIIGMDILRPLGIIVHTKEKRLSVKNKIWEAFKTLSAAGVLILAGIKILESLFGEEQ